MTAENTSFDNAELGKVIMTLSRICRNCSLAATCPIFTSNCPIGKSRDLLLQYKNDQCQIRKDVQFTDTPVRPMGAEIPEESAKEVLDIIPELCNKCMFHGDKCFLNVVYHWIEIMLKVAPRKPQSERPKSSPP